MEGQPHLQFDSSLGGSEILPDNINIKKFTTARIQEIAALTEAIGNVIFFCKFQTICIATVKHSKRTVCNK